MVLWSAIKCLFYHCSLFGVIIIVTLINAAVWGTENQSTVANLCYFASKIYTKKNTTTAKLQYVNDHDIYRSGGALELYVQMYALECSVDKHRRVPWEATILSSSPVWRVNAVYGGKSAPMRWEWAGSRWVVVAGSHHIIWARCSR